MSICLVHFTDMLCNPFSHRQYIIVLVCMISLENELTMVCCLLHESAMFIELLGNDVLLKPQGHF